MAVKPGGVLLRNFPGRSLFQCFGGEKEVFGLPELSGGAAAQARQGDKRACLASIELPAQLFDHRGQVRIVEGDCMQCTGGSAPLGRQEKVGRRRADGAHGWHSLGLYMLEWYRLQSVS